MGIGDQLIATGLARDAWSKRGTRVAFGADKKLIWDKHSEIVFRHNPNIAFPGNEVRGKVEWIPYYKGNRQYNTQGDGHWIWNMDWRCTPGEMYFMPGEERAVQSKTGKDFVLIEPNVPDWKKSAGNKRWPFSRYQEVANQLLKDGHTVIQLHSSDGRGGQRLGNVKQVVTTTFRQAALALKSSSLYIGSEGGMHHAAAAVSVPAVVIFGGFIPPSVTGYSSHVNLVGSDRFCGSFQTCAHCLDAMDKITVDQVYSAAKEKLGKRIREAS